MKVLGYGLVTQDDLDKIEYITKKQKDGLIYKYIPKKYVDEFEDVMDGLRWASKIGVYGNNQQKKMLEAIPKKVVFEWSRV